MNEIIELVNISKSFHKSILNDFSLSIFEGDFLVIKGESGVGKTTLLNIIGLIEPFDKGNLLIEGKDISFIKPSNYAKLRNDLIGYVFQMYHLIPSLSVIENISLPTLYGNNKGINVKELLSLFKIEDLKNKNIINLSGGEKQRVCLARALIQDPKIILADEPTGSLDSVSSKNVVNHLKNLNQRGKTIVVVTHSNEFDDLATKVIKLGNHHV